LPYLNPDSVLPFWYRLTQVVIEKRPLNGFSVVVVAVQRVSWLSNNSIDKISTDSASRGPSVAAELPVDIKKVAHTPLPSVVPELIPVLGSQPAGDVSHKPGGRLPLLSARPAVPPATLKRAATTFAAW